MSRKLSFVGALASPSRPSTRPNQWEMHLQTEINKLQGENAALREQMNKMEFRLAMLEGKPDPVAQTTAITTKVREEVKEEIQAAKEQFKVVKDTMHEHMKTDVISTIKEEELRANMSTHIWMGGLPEAWHTQDVSEADDEEKYVSESELMKRRIHKALPSIGLGSPWAVVAKGTNAILKYDVKKEKVAVLRQSSKLKGTKLWITDALTPMQLKQKSSELTKVRQARQAGKWAVYREGKAMIEDFRNPKP